MSADVGDLGSESAAGVTENGRIEGDSGDQIDWDLARKVAVRAAGSEPYTAAMWRRGVEEDFAAYTEQAEELVAEHSGLRSLAGPARGRLTDRVGWIDANLASFQRLLRPLTQKLAQAGGSDSALAPLTRRVAGTELGMMLGWMSTRVLGQYDLLVIEDEKPEDQDIVYYVVPNVVSLETRHAFDPGQFRLWLALHEVTHRAQFTGVDWLRRHFIGLIEATLESVETDPKRIMAAMRRVVEARQRGEDPLETGGLIALFAPQEQLETLNQVSGLMSLLEGHGDVIMDRAGEGLIPSAPRFARVMRRRRASARGLTKVLHRVTGLDAKIKQYAQGERFIEIVESAGGSALLNRVWEAPENLPDFAEIKAPLDWVDRMGVPELAA